MEDMNKYFGYFIDPQVSIMRYFKLLPPYKSRPYKCIIIFEREIPTIKWHFPCGDA